MELLDQYRDRYPQEMIPTLLAVIRELVLIDKETLKEVIRVGKCQLYVEIDPSEGSCS